MPIEALGARWIEGQAISISQWGAGGFFMFAGAISLVIGTWWDKVSHESTGRFAASFDGIVRHAATWMVASVIIVFGVPITIGLMATPVITSPPAIQTPVLNADTSKIADLTGQVASLKSQLDAKTTDFDAAQHKLQDAQNRLSLVPASPPIDMLSGQPKNLFISIGKVFNAIIDQQYKISAKADELAKEQSNQSALSPLFYYVPPCRIIVSSMKDNESFAKFIETIAQSHGCQAEDAPVPPPPPRPTNADEPPPKPIIIPDPCPYIIVRYPNPEDVQNLPEPSYAMGIGRFRQLSG